MKSLVVSIVYYNAFFSGRVFLMHNGGNSMTIPYPLRTEPFYQDYLWGGRKLESVLGKAISGLRACGRRAGKSSTIPSIKVASPMVEYAGPFSTRYRDRGTGVDFSAIKRVFSIRCRYCLSTWTARRYSAFKCIPTINSQARCLHQIWARRKPGISSLLSQGPSCTRA